MHKLRRLVLGGVLAVFFAAVISSHTLAQQCVPQSTDIVAWWPFDETAGTDSTDIVGTNDGLHIGGPLPAPGMVDGSLRFDGINDYVAVPDSDLWAFGTQEFSIEFWASFDIGAHGSQGHPGDVFISNDEGPFNIPKWFFALNSSTLDFLTCCGPGWAFSPNAPFNPVVGDWYHLAVTRSGTDYRIYVDGQLIKAGPNSSIIPNINAILTIGRALEPFGGFMNGRLDEMTVYNRALTDNEIKAIFDAGSAGKCKGPSIDTPSEFAITLGKFHSQQFNVDGGQAPFLWSVVAGQLPTGMGLSTDGVFSGTPTKLGAALFTVEAVDGSGTIAVKDLSVEVVLVPPPSDLRFSKSGSITVPGRDVDYFILVENASSAVARDSEVLEILHPVSFFDLVSTNPVPQQITEMSILWTIPELGPGETEILSYTVELNPTIQFGTKIPGGVFAGASGQALEASKNWVKSVENAQCKASTPECATLLAICALPGCHPFSNLSTCASCPSTWEKCTANCDHCDLFPDEFRVECDDATGPIDPNEKLVVAERFIQPDQTLVYPIHYENIGQVEALDVFVTDILDAKLDDSTLKILSPGASYDQTTRTLRWELFGRNLLPGETDNVLFSIKPILGLPSGTAIRNDAEIQFEIFTPLVTPEVVNIIDTTPPECVMDSLPPQTTTEDFTVSWSSSDAVGEVAEQSVFVSVDGGTFSPIVENTLETQTLFNGMSGRSYGFLCAAKDTAGNVEPQGSIAEVQTAVAVPIPGDLDSDGDVDRDDMNIILAARNQPASGPDDLRDLDGDGVITVLDARQLAQLCTRPRCATQ